jgi:hypothetical protein
MDAKERVSEAILEALHNCASKGYLMSQEACPIKTGYLKQSGSYAALPNGSKITYSAPYASNIERDQQAGIEHVKGHYVGSNYIKPYIRKVKAKEGSHFIENSLKSSFSNMANELDALLRTHFVVKRR